MNKILFSSEKEDWETPKELFKKLNEKYNFNVDLCANDKNNLCEEYYTKENSCFKNKEKLKDKRIYCNPPYGRKIKHFIKYCYEIKDQNEIIVMLIPARTDTIWFHNYIYKKSEIIFIKGRLRFSNSKNTAPFPSMIVIYNKEVKK